MKRLTLGTLVLGMCLFWVSTAHAQTGFIPVFIDDFGTEGSSNIFQTPDGWINIEISTNFSNIPVLRLNNLGAGGGLEVSAGPGSASAITVSTSAFSGQAIRAGCTSPLTVDCTAIVGFADRGADGVFGSGRVSGVHGLSNDPNGSGVRGNSLFGGTGGLFETGSGNILVGRGMGGNRFRVDALGNVFANSYNIGMADFAESIEPAGRKDDYEPGDVLVIDQTAARRVAFAQQPYSTLVAGIYSSKPGILASPHHMDDPRLAAEIPLAIVGIVICKVSAENGPIKPGDLLVTSSTPGYAMKGTDRSRMLGAVVGKALELLPSGKGVIHVLVTLQ